MNIHKRVFRDIILYSPYYLWNWKWIESIWWKSLHPFCFERIKSIR